MPELWMPGATRMDIGDHAPTDGGAPKAIAHTTWDKNASAAKPLPLVPYGDLVSYFGTNPTGRAVASHVLWSPFTGRCTQFVPANSRSKSLVDLAGGTRTNRAGAVVLQIEAHFFPNCLVDGKVYAQLADTPCLGWAELHAWVRSWGVPDVWPMGRPVDYTPHRSESVWATQAGWYGHSQVPENTHQDPGSWPGFTITQETDMATAAEVWSYSHGDVPDVHQTLANAAASAKAAATGVSALTTTLATVKAEVEALKAAGGATAAQLEAAGEAGARAALAALGHTLVDGAPATGA